MCHNWLHTKCLDIDRKSIRKYVGKLICCEEVSNITSNSMAEAMSAQSQGSSDSEVDKTLSIQQTSESEFRRTVLDSLKQLTQLTTQLNVKVDGFSERLSAIESDLGIAKKRSELQQKQLDDIRDKLGVIEGTALLQQQATNSLTEDLSQVKVQIKSLEDKIPEDQDIQNSIQQALQSGITSCELKLDDLEAQGRKHNVEIHGVPELENENQLKLTQMVIKLAAVTGTTLTPDDIDVIHRVKSYKTEFPRYIIVKFRNRSIRNSFYHSAKSNKNLKSDLLVPDHPSRSIYINENLTSKRKLLLRRAKEELRPKGVHYIWTREGKILVKAVVGSVAREGREHPVYKTFEVRLEKDITDILQYLVN